MSFISLPSRIHFHILVQILLSIGFPTINNNGKNKIYFWNVDIGQSMAVTEGSLPNIASAFCYCLFFVRSNMKRFFFSFFFLCLSLYSSSFCNHILKRFACFALRLFFFFHYHLLLAFIDCYLYRCFMILVHVSGRFSCHMIKISHDQIYSCCLFWIQMKTWWIDRRGFIDRCSRAKPHFMIQVCIYSHTFPMIIYWF